MTVSAPRILFVDHTGALGGAQLCLEDIASAFRDRCAVALFEDGPLATALMHAGVAVIPIAAGAALRTVKKDSRVPGAAAILATGRATMELKRAAAPFAVLYANSPKSFIVSAAAGVLARRPVIWHLHDILDRQHFSRPNVMAVVTAANVRAARVIANSQATADAFVAAGGRRDVVRVVYNGIDGAPFDQLPPETRALTRRALGIPEDAFLVGSFSRLHPWKGQRVLFDALERLPDVHALIVGGALFSGEASYESELRARAGCPPLAGRVHILGARTDVPELIMACDVIAHPSVWPEPFGRVLVEALLANKPLIASDAGGVREVVRHGVTALLVPPGDATRLAQAIRSIISDAASAASMAAAGSADVRARFSLGASITGVKSVIDEVLDAR